VSVPETILIVGAGLAGVTAAGALRESGFAGRIVLLGEEPELPYDRPPLSKSVLVHDNLEQLVAAHLPSDIALRSPVGIALRPKDWYSEHRIELKLGRRAARLDIAAHAVELEDGERVAYDRLLLAPGSSPRRLPGMESGPVTHAYLRTLGDALEIRNRLRPGTKIVLLGGGVIGMEVAASAALRDCEVTVVELAPRIMARALCPTIADHLATYHRAKGVQLKLGAHAVGQASGSAPGLQLKDGTVVPADLIVIGIGVIPNTELASTAGIACEDGILVDEFGATGAPDVYAAGDAVRYPDELSGRRIRSENWMHAQNQSLVVAKNLLGSNEPYRQVSHMWSDQYDLKIQVAGLADTEGAVLRGTLEANKFLMFHLDNGKIVGATGINEPRDMKFAQRLIEARVTIEAEKLRDPAFNLKKALQLADAARQS
jgi:3-phenylpropionate/trans-cinnamate dioxygenase ferredoxin reductase subunit